VLGSCVADEAVTVDVEVANPLQVSRSELGLAGGTTHSVAVAVWVPLLTL